MEAVRRRYDDGVCAELGADLAAVVGDDLFVFLGWVVGVLGGRALAREMLARER